MKTKLTWVYSAFWGAMILFTFLGWSGNPPDGRTGAPGDGLCTDCHTPGNPNGYDGGITIQNFPSTINAGQTYNLTALVSNPNGLASVAGFQAVVLDSGNQNAGDIVAPGNPSSTTTGNGREYVEHNPSLAFPGSNQVTWNFDWTAPSGPNGENITIYAAGNIASGSNGNSEDLIVTTSASGTLMGATDPLAVTIIDQTNVDCNGDATGTATAEATDGTPPYSYSWPTGSGATITMLPAGTYTVTATDSNSGMATASVTITENPPIIPSIVTQNNIDCINPTGSALITATGGAMGYTYMWPSGNTNPQEINLIAGLHQATITDALGCIATIDVIITEDINTPIADAGLDQTLDCQTPSVELNGSGSSIGPNISYFWSTTTGNIVSGPTAISVTVNAPGLYTLNVTDNSNGCTSSDVVEVFEIPNTSISLIKTDPSCANVSDGSIDVIILAGESPFDFDWSDDAFDGQQNLTGLPAGTYEVTVTDDIGCTDEAMITLTDPSAIAIGANFINPTCPDYCNGSIELFLSGGVPPYTTVWDNAADTVFIEDLCADTYMAIVTDANGCQDSLTISLFNPNVVQVTATLVDETCAGSCDGSITINATGGTLPYTYAWDNDPSNISNDTTGCTGFYTVTVTDAIGCFTVHTDEISGPDSLMMTFTTVDETCFGECTGEIDITVTGGTGSYTYAWDDPSIGNVPDPTNLCEGTYMVTVTDENNCELVESITIVGPPAINIAETITHVSCNGDCDGAIALVVTGGTPSYSFLWNDAAMSTTANLTGICAGLYSVTVTDSNNCSQVGNFEVTEPNELTNTITTTNESGSGANDGTATANPNGGTSPFTYLWSNNETTQTIDNLSPGTYTVTVTDDNGCTVETSGVVSPFNCNLDATVTTTDETQVDGDDGTATANPIDGTSPYTYLWSNNETTQTIDNLSPGTYEVTITDDDGCIAIASGTVNAFNCNLELTVSSTDETGFEANDGTATATPTNGTMPYTYLWSNNETTQTIDNLSPGIYVVTVTDDVGCTAVGEAEVEAFLCNLEVTITATDETGFEANDGTATAVATGGTMPYSYLWSNGEITQTIDNLSPGAYFVTVTDDNDCTVVQQTGIAAFVCDFDQLEVTATPETAANANDGTATATASGGSMPYTYLWNNNETSQTIDNLEPGNYSVTVTDDDGCTLTGSVDVPSAGCNLELDLTAENVSCAAGSDGTATATVTNGTSPYTYTWSTGGNTSTETNLSAGTVSVTITDDEGCTIDGSIEVMEPTAMTGTATGSNSGCGAACLGTLNVVVTGGAGGYTFEPSVLTNLCPGIYAITVTDANGCQIVIEGEVPEGNAAIEVEVNTTPVSTIGGSDGTAMAIVTGATGGLTYIWSNNATSQNIDGLTQGQYCVTVNEVSTGCLATACGFVESPSCDFSISTEVTHVLCNGENTGVAMAIPTGGTEPITYSWSSSTNTSDTEDGLTAGMYTVIATDAIGCMAESSFEILEFPELVVNVSTTSETAMGANDGTATANVSGGPDPNYLYLWSDGQITPTINSLSPGTYCVTVTDSNGCTTEACNSVNQFGCDISVALSQNNFTCPGVCDGTFDVTVTGGAGAITYSWSGPTIPDPDPVGLCAGTYFLTVTDEMGCTAEATTVINEYTEINVEVNVNEASCDNECDASVELIPTGDGPFNFDWAIDSLDGQNGGSNLCTGLYEVTIIDANQCAQVVSFELGAAGTIVLESNILAACFDECNGQLNFSVSGGVEPYTFATDLPSNLSEICAGDYSIEVTDANGCQLMETIVIPENPEILVTIDSIEGSDPTMNNGLIHTTASGGTGSLSYMWFLNGDLVSSDADLDGLEPGDYEYIVEDETGCSVTDTVTVPEIVGTTGIFAANDITVFPNPARTFINLKFNIVENLEVNITMYDLLGRMVLSENRNVGATQLEQLNTDELTTGLYTLVIQSGDSMWSTKIIVQQY